MLIAAGGLERCGESVLLRSVVTHADYRGRGLAGEVVQTLHQAAMQAGYQSCWLLTMDAARYFAARHGYHVAAREDAPEGGKKLPEVEAVAVCTDRRGRGNPSRDVTCARTSAVAGEGRLSTLRWSACLAWSTSSSVGGVLTSLWCSRPSSSCTRRGWGRRTEFVNT